jgi:hypothetical protein
VAFLAKPVIGLRVIRQRLVAMHPEDVGGARSARAYRQSRTRSASVASVPLWTEFLTAQANGLLCCDFLHCGGGHAGWMRALVTETTESF